MADQNLWLAELGYATLVRVLRQQWPDLVAFPIEATLADLPPHAQHAWLAAAAAIRRQVGPWGLSAEEGDHARARGGSGMSASADDKADGGVVACDGCGGYEAHEDLTSLDGRRWLCPACLEADEEERDG